MKEAVQQLSEMPNVRAACEAMALAHRKPSKDLVVSLAFSIGVMLAQVRLKHSQFRALEKLRNFGSRWEPSRVASSTPCAVRCELEASEPF